eukprot:6174830-Pleurochrysis_carterae.AAC.1
MLFGLICALIRFEREVKRALISCACNLRQLASSSGCACPHARLPAWCLELRVAKVVGLVQNVNSVAVCSVPPAMLRLGLSEGQRERTSCAGRARRGRSPRRDAGAHSFSMSPSDLVM